MGYRGPASGLLDAETNLKYAVRYLRGAYLVANGNFDQAVGFYARGYYYDAKRRGMLEATGLGQDRRRMRRAAPVEVPEVLPVAAPTPEAMPGVTPETMPAFAPVPDPAA
jgi:soluble lytic murein transglycosylase-like protein